MAWPARLGHCQAMSTATIVMSQTAFVLVLAKGPRLNRAVPGGPCMRMGVCVCGVGDGASQGSVGVGGA